MVAVKKILSIIVTLIIFSSVGVAVSFAYFVPEKVSEGVFRGPRPEEPALRELSGMGIKTVLSLESNSAVVAAEENLCRALNIKFINIPLSEAFRPSQEDLKRAVDVIQQNREDGIYVHCRRGIDRTGYVIASFRILVEKWTLDEAYEECCAFGHSPLVYFFWRGALKAISNGAPDKAGQDQHAFLQFSGFLTSEA